MKTSPVPAFLCAAILSGCVSVPTPPRGSAWTPPPDARQSDAGWLALRERTPSFTRPLTLADLADLALQSNPATAAAWQTARTASERVTQAQGYFMPEFVASASAGLSRTLAEPSSFDADRVRYGAGLSMDYLVVNLGGGRRAAVEQALNSVYAANYACNRAVDDVLLGVATSYYGLLSARAAAEAAGASVRDARRTLETAQEVLRQGLGTKLDVLQAQATLDRRQYGLATAENVAAVARGALARAVGIPADTPFDVLPVTNAAPPAAAVGDMRAFIDEALNRRPDIAALRASLRAAEAAVRVAAAAQWPSLYLTGAMDETLHDLRDGQAMQDRDLTYSAGLALRWTLFDGLRSVSARRIAESDAEAARANLLAAELGAGADVWTRCQNYASAVEKLRAAETYLGSASAAHGLAIESYRARLRTLVDLLTAEAQLAEARAQAVAARQEAFMAFSALAHAAGRLTRDGLVATEKPQTPPARKDNTP
jgi:outer membrane protein TolC